MDKPIPEAVDLLALEGAADYLAGRYSERDGWVQSIRAAIRSLTAAQQQGQAVAFDIERARTLAEYVVGYARAAELKSLSSDACVALRDLHAMLHAQPMQQGGGEVCPRCKGAGEYEGFARHASGDPQDEYATTVQCEPCEGTGEVAAPPSAPVGPVQKVLADMKADAFNSRGQYVGDVLNSWAAAFERALAQQPAAVDEAMVERATMALLGKSHDTAPGIDWRCDRSWTVNKVRKHMRAALTDALAAKPAVVDGAMVERAALAYEAEVDGDTHSPNVPREAMRAALNAALATQHQEPTT